MRQFHPKFISKKELGKGIPSVSFNLRHGGSALIDRKNPMQAVEAIRKLALYCKGEQAIGSHISRRNAQQDREAQSLPGQGSDDPV